MVDVWDKTESILVTTEAGPSAPKGIVPTFVGGHITVLPYLCGDASHDAEVNVSDAVFIINYVFVGGDPPDPLEAGDVNCDGNVNVSDAVWIINFVFTGGNSPCDTDGDGQPDC